MLNNTLPHAPLLDLSSGAIKKPMNPYQNQRRKPFSQLNCFDGLWHSDNNALQIKLGRNGFEIRIGFTDWKQVSESEAHTLISNFNTQTQPTRQPKIDQMK